MPILAIFYLARMIEKGVPDQKLRIFGGIVAVIFGIYYGGVVALAAVVFGVLMVFEGTATNVIELFKSFKGVTDED